MLFVDRLTLKRDAKRVVMTSKPSPLLIALGYVVVLYIISLLYSRISGFSEYYNLYYENLRSAMLDGGDLVMPAYPSVAPVALVLALALYVVNLILQNAGWVNYCLKLSRGQKAGFSDILEVFVKTGKILWLYILQGIFVTLWSCLFVVPGIIAFYRYRQAIYILLDDPRLGALECIRRSKAMMAGHKGLLFVLDLSFIGWNLLYSIAFVVGVWTEPYTGVTYAGFYNNLMGLPDTYDGSFTPEEN
jgi:uncharacterized membrane protein